MLVALLLALLIVPAATFAQELAPGTRYDPAIPTLSQVVGHDPGEEITTPQQVAVYLAALAEAAPDRTHLVKYAETWEGRPLFVLAIASPDRIARIDQVKAELRRLADPRTLSPAEADRLVSELPVVTWLFHGVHGNEISSSDAALAEAYHLLAAQGDEVVETILRESVVLIDPMQNPDGRARFVYQHLLGRAATPDPEPAAAEHDEPWPGGRANHYLFDMNRDWFAQTQPETRGRIELYLEWFPHIAVDLHEMGGNSTYYFAPPTEPLNPYLTEPQTRWLETFGKANAARFDARGFPYFIREVYDAFYPGYGDSWPALHGAIGMTFEQASARGLVFRRRDETLLSYKDGVVGHFTAAIATAETAARNRERIARDFLEYRRGAVEEGANGSVREYLFSPGKDPARAERLAQLLLAQGIDVRVAEEPVALGNQTLPAGTYIVPLAQPAGRLARNLLDPHIPMGEEFVKEQDRRRRKRLSDQIYDVTAWSLPLLYDVTTVAADRPTQTRSSRLEAAALGPHEALVTREPGFGARDSGRSTGRPLPPAKVAYLMPWGVGTVQTVVQALAAGIRVRFADRGFTLGGRSYARGTAIVRVSDNGADVAARLGAITDRHGTEAVATDTAWVEDGISLGSNQVVALKPPRVLLAWDSPVSSQSAGWARYVLERRYGQAVTAVRVRSLGRVDFGRYDVLVLPAGSYSPALDEQLIRRLKDWVGRGGTLVTLGEASRWAAREGTALLETRTELRDGSPETDPTDEDESKSATSGEPFDLEQAIEPERERPEEVPGALLRVALDTEHWLSAGVDEEIQAVVVGRRVFTPIKLDKGVNIGVYASRDRLIASGLAWDEALELLAQKAFLIHQPMGQGHLIAFSEDPNYRAFAEVTQLLFLNAVLLGPGH